MEDRRKGLLLSACVSSFLLANFIGGAVGDVPDGVVYTDLHKTVQQGKEIVLTCDFYGAPVAVYWKKGDDPDSGADLISWVYEEEISGSCVNNKACHMTDDYSLVITDARIADQGRYICQISNYLGIILYNYTDVKMYAPPKEPYPVIDGCAEKESSGYNSTNPCRILTNATISITCSATNYYPELDLFFLHGSQKMTDIITSENSNIDETKNTSISIKAFASKNPYVCVASGITGSKDQRAATIFVESSTAIPITRANERLPTPFTSIADTTEISPGNPAAKIVVPIVLIFVIGAVVIFFFLWWKHRRPFRSSTTGHGVTGSNSAKKSDSEERIPMVEEATIAGDLSFFELWSLAYETPDSDMMKVHHALDKLGIKDGKEKLTSPDIYKLLCKWKDEHKKGQNARLLQSALKSADFESRWVQLCEQRRYGDVKIPGATLEQIILDIQSLKQIQQFLRNLLPGQSVNIKGDPVEKAMKLLREWMNSSLKENPFALLSLALERCGCSPVAQTFFPGTVSFFELWSLSRMIAESDVDKVRDTLQNLKLLPQDALTADDVYFHLCCWKESNKTSTQGKTLRDAFERSDYKEAWKNITEHRQKSHTRVSESTLEHILWHIRDPMKIYNFLHELTSDNPHTHSDIINDLKGVVKEALGHLQTWMKQQFGENPIILLSHALEKTGCCPVDRLFFKVPLEVIANINELEVRGFVDELTVRHIKTLTQCLGIDKKDDTIYAINEANKDTIFNTEAMITEWIAHVECTHYEKRWRLNEAIARIRRQDLTDHFGKNLNPEIHLGVEKGTTSSAHSKGHTMKMEDLNLIDFVEDEFQRITTYLSSSQMKELFGIGDDDPRNELRAYVEGFRAENPKQNWRDKLRKKLKSPELKGLIPYTLESNLYLCELLDLAFRLLLDDVYPLAEALGISGERLKRYRVDYAPDHLTKGTTAALIKFSETNKNDRGKVREALFNSGYRDLALLLQYGHETCLADEFAVASRSGGNREDLANISMNLGINDMDTVAVLREWKAMVHPASYNHITALADAVFPVLGVDVALAILTGKYREDGCESSEVIRTIRSGIESFELSLIQKIIGVTNPKKLQDEQVTTQSQGTELLGDIREVRTDNRRHYKPAIALMISHILGVNITDHSAASSISQVLETWEEKIKKKPLKKDDRRELSDKLLRAGFKQFAFEIMTGFVPRPGNKPK